MNVTDTEMSIKASVTAPQESVTVETTPKETTARHVKTVSMEIQGQLMWVYDG